MKMQKPSSPSSQHRRHRPRKATPELTLIVDADRFIMKGNKCSLCSKESLLQCEVCKVAFYCGHDCQAKDHEKHNDICKMIMKLTGTISKEKTGFHASSYVEPHFDGFLTDENHGETHTHLYMKTRVSLFNLLDDIGTEWALREAIAHGKELMKDGRGNYPEVRYMIPSMYLRLTDPKALQKCYDFMKWGHIYAGKYEQEVAHQNDQSDMCEDAYFVSRVDLYNVVALTIIKMRLLLQIDQFLTEFDLLLHATIRPSSFMYTFRGNQGVLLSVASFLLPNYACFTNRMMDQLRVLRQTLSTQVQTLLEFAKASNKCIWKMMVSPARYSSQPRNLRFPSNVSSRILTVVLCYLPFFNAESRESRAMRQILVDRMGDSPSYELTFAQLGSFIIAH